MQSPEDPERCYIRGTKILGRFYRENLPFRKGLLPMPEVEKPFAFRFTGHRVAGKKDRIQPLEKGGEALIDYKTGSWRPSLAERQRDIQFTIYNLDYLLKTGRNPKKMWIEILDTGERVSVPARRQKDYVQLAQWLNEAAIFVKSILRPTTDWRNFPFRLLNPEDIETKQFSPRPGSWCGRCEYEKICRTRKLGDSFREKWVEIELKRSREKQPGQLELALVL